MDNRKFLPLIIVGVVGLFIIFAFSSSIFYTVEATERAVVFYPWSNAGLDKENIISPGLHFKAPWNEVYKYEVSENKEDEKMDVLDKDGLSIQVDITVTFHPMEERIGHIHEKFNREYIDKLVIPQVRSSVRQVMGRYTAEEIYALKRAEVENAIITETEDVLKNNNVKMERLLIRSIILPERITAAIESKLTAQQEALAKEYEKQKEEKDAEIKKVRALGEATANEIINNSLTPQLLRMRGIEATLELSKSPNSKVVIIGSQKDGMPLILGDK